METPVYDHFFRAEERHWWFRGRRRVITDFLDHHFPAGNLRIADIGCGTGGMLGTLARYGSVTGVDEAPEARAYCGRRGFPGVLTPGAWEAAGGSYDLVTVFDVVEHVEDDVAFLRGLASRLVPGGHLLATVPAYPFLWSFFDEMNHHKRRYVRKELERSVTSAGFEVVRSTHFNTWLFPPMALVRLFDRSFRKEPATEAERNRALQRWFRVGPLNRVLESILASEGGWVPRRNLPFGSSILVLGKARA